MSRDILSGFGRDAYKPQEPGASHGGIMPVKDCSYSSPVGPINIHRPGPGLPGGADLGNKQKFAEGDSLLGSPGLHSNNYGNAGTQGKR